MEYTLNHSSADRTAMYLRCYPYDTSQMATHQKKLLRQARRLGLAEPVLYLDNGVRSFGPRPALEQFLQRSADGVYKVLLVTGLFVFSIHDNEARALAEGIRSFGCEIVELPSPTRFPATGVNGADLH
ncbi:hypothetical protein FBY35_1251 [Streptomyces sp. SLBN-118]|uniref:hypothetical protein n=1 Tax=Streptomyces sp. SLBN-118 TaxID=2768454 RepID=UPI00114E5C2C|nr:hypothetical protein [Streptomyces sp. SLBN-118]TQK50889.1 hypothetical protein FBY35_1251 [Streptomyces sp. SLBN-118]